MVGGEALLELSGRASSLELKVTNSLIPNQPNNVNPLSQSKLLRVKLLFKVLFVRD